jgi:WD40 repeat protein
MRFAGQPAELVAVLGEPGPSYYRVCALAFRPDCKLLAVSTGPPEIALWDFGKGTPQRLPNLRGHSSLVASLAFTPDGKWLASGGGNNNATGDNAIRIWDVAQARAVAVLPGHTSTVNTLAVSPDGKWLASSGQDLTVRLSDLEQHDSRLLVEKTTFVNSLAYAPDGKTLAIAGSYWPHVRVQDIAQAGKFVDLKYAPEQHAHKVAFSSDGRTLAVAANGPVVLWDADKQVERARLKAQAHAVRDLVFLPDCRSLLCGEGGEESQTNVNEPEGQVVIWAAQSNQAFHTWRLPCGGVKRLALASDGRHLAVGGRNSVVYILRLAPPKLGQ